MAVEDAVVVRTLSKNYDGIKAVDGVSIALPENQTYALIGPNGAGKTTLFRLIAGEERPSSGTIELFGTDVTHLPSHMRARLGVGRTFQVTSLFPTLSVSECLILGTQVKRSGSLRWWSRAGRGPDISREVDRVLEMVGLSDVRNRPVRELAYGQQRQLEFGVALIGDPRLLLLDEPAAGLAGDDQDRIYELLSDLKKSITVLIVEHDIDLVWAVADVIACMDAGKLIAQGSPNEILANEAVQRVYLGSALEHADGPAKS